MAAIGNKITGIKIMDLSIEVKGGAGTGKTVVSRIIREALEAHGVTVAVIDYDNYKMPDEEFLAALPSFSGKFIVVENTQTARRNSYD